MFLREGSQQQGALVAVCCALLSLTWTMDTASAAGFARAGGLELPREILPWRRDVERRAQSKLAAARETIRTGNAAVAERQLRELIRQFPRTHAASDGKRDLAKLNDRQGYAGRHGLGIQPPLRRQQRKAERVDPIAGWQTIVQPDPADLREALIDAAGDRVFFSEGVTSLSARAQTVLKKQARWLLMNRHIEVRIAGHADDTGTPESNMRLSHDRAMAVRKYLIRYGVEAKRLHVFSHGRAQPIAICSITTCAAQNRRVVTEIRPTRSARMGLQ